MSEMMFETKTIKALTARTRRYARFQMNRKVTHSRRSAFNKKYSLGRAPRPSQAMPSCLAMRSAHSTW